MSCELAPRTRDARPPPLPAALVARAAAASLAAAALFWSPLCLGGALRGGDWSSHHLHYFDWVRIAFVEHGTLPLYMADAWVTPNLLANAESPSLGPLVWLLALLPTDAYVKLLLVAHTAVGLLGALRVVLPLRFGARGAEWEAGSFVPLAQEGKVSIEVPAGAHEIALAYRPPWLREGLAVSAASVALLVVRRARARRSTCAVWGIRHALGLAGTPLAEAARAWNTLVCFAPIAALARLRRGRREPRALGTTLCASFALLYGTTSFFAFQYLAWSLPFWFFLDARIAAAATGLLAAYVWGVYALFTGSPLLLGRWDFVRHAPWPPLLSWLRDASVVACWLVGWGTLARSALRGPERSLSGG